MELVKHLRAVLGFLVSPKISTLDKLRAITLKEINIPAVSVNGDSLVKLDQLADSASWTHAFGFSPDLTPVKEAIKSFVKVEKFYEERFDFSLLDSFCSSKSFMSPYEETNASRYASALEWGLNMWEGDNLSFTTDADFENNIAHLMREGIGSSGEISVYIFGWHKELVLWSNTGGSHHAAALIRQMYTQNREFYCKAKVTRYSINKHVFTPVLKDFHLLISCDDCIKDGGKYYLGLALSEMNICFSTCGLPIRGRNYQLLVIPKQQEVISSQSLSLWVRENVSSKRMLEFVDFILE